MDRVKVILIFSGSVLLIFVAIIFTNLIDRTKNGATNDIRSRASNTTGYTMLTGTITNVLSFNQIEVSNLKFEKFNQSLDGAWTITIASGTDNKVTSGNIRIFAHPDIKFEQHTLTAEKIERK
jgi:hypothetical protein